MSNKLHIVVIFIKRHRENVIFVGQSRSKSHNGFLNRHNLEDKKYL